jgi:hypothetical protein
MLSVIVPSAIKHAPIQTVMVVVMVLIQGDIGRRPVAEQRDVAGIAAHVFGMAGAA